MSNIITATPVKANQRLAFLPKHLGSLGLTMRFERLAYRFMDGFCKTYSGGYWQFYNLSNEGFYMAPNINEVLPIFVNMNGFEGKVSADAAGIIVSLYSLNYLCNDVLSERLIDKYYLLRGFFAGRYEISHRPHITLYQSRF